MAKCSMCDTWRSAGRKNCKLCGALLDWGDEGDGWEDEEEYEPEPSEPRHSPVARAIEEDPEPVAQDGPPGAGCLVGIILGSLVVLALIALINPWVAAILAVVELVWAGLHYARRLGQHEEALAQSRLRELELRAELERERRRDR